MTLRNLFSVLLLATMAACASAGANKRSSSYDRDQISREELEERSYATMFDVVNSIRPNWLRTSMGASGGGGSTAAAPLVYVDGRRLGTTEQLRSVSAQSVQSARYLSATEAQNKFGMGEARPVIEVTTRGRAP